MRKTTPSRKTTIKKKIGKVASTPKAKVLVCHSPLTGGKLLADSCTLCGVSVDILSIEGLTPRDWEGYDIKLTPLRHPAGVFRQIVKNQITSSTPDLVIDFFLKFIEIRRIMGQQGFTFIRFPADWYSVRIKDVFNRAGIKWNEDVCDHLFKRNLPAPTDATIINQYNKQSPEMAEAYNVFDEWCGV
ncbi:hypothetical protein LCGC14_1886380 [marine sediment metagenome]|uniref:Uncharacterized protein n=1 Tax=marine sediment metagenome TaxID=412755 RepID=A0A0F9IZ48_9ZZZZ